MGVSKEILRNIHDARGKGDREGVSVWRKILRVVKSFEKLEKIKQLPPEKTPQQENQFQEPVEETVKKYVDRFIRMGFHRELRQSEEEYRNSFILPQNTDQPDDYKGQWDLPVVVDPRIPLPFLHDKARIDKGEGPLSDLVGYPDHPYVIWAGNPNKYRFFNAKEAKGLFLEDEVGATYREVLFLSLQHPEFFRDYNIDAPGSSYGGTESGIPYLGLEGGPKFGAFFDEYEDDKHGVLTRGEEIILLGKGSSQTLPRSKAA